MAANLRNRAVKDGGTGGTHPDLPRYLRRKPCIAGLPHHFECLLDAILGNQAQERRLIELHGQTLAQRAVENGIPRRVGEVGEDNSVFFGELWRAVEV
jgi:hypothetical protein